MFPIAVEGNSFKALQVGLSHLLAAQAEISLAISDFELSGRRLVERAFLHLQRSLVVDQDLRERWLTAFHKEGEPALEKLGAVHLLSMSRSPGPSTSPRRVTGSSSARIGARRSPGTRRMWTTGWARKAWKNARPNSARHQALCRALETYLSTSASHATPAGFPRPTSRRH